MSVLAIPDVGASRQLGRAAVGPQVGVATESVRGPVLDSNLYRSLPLSTLGGCPDRLVCLSV
jgi:hypothetical protein